MGTVGAQHATRRAHCISRDVFYMRAASPNNPTTHAHAQVDSIKETLSNEEQKMGADIIKRALSYPIKLIANNAGTNGSVVMQRVMDNIDQPVRGRRGCVGGGGVCCKFQPKRNQTKLKRAQHRGT